MATTTHLKHDPTGTHVEIGGRNMGGTRIEQVLVQTPNVLVQRQRFTDPDSEIDFVVEDVHVHCTSGEVTAKVVDSKTTALHVTVQLGSHQTLYLPMTVVEAVAAAVAAVEHV